MRVPLLACLCDGVTVSLSPKLLSEKKLSSFLFQFSAHGRHFGILFMSQTQISFSFRYISVYILIRRLGTGVAEWSSPKKFYVACYEEPMDETIENYCLKLIN